MREVAAGVDADVAPVQVGSTSPVPAAPPVGTSSPKRGSVGCSAMTKYQPGAGSTSSRVRSKPTKVTSGSIRPQKIGSSMTDGVGSKRAVGLRGGGVDDGVGVAPQQLAADEQDQRAAQVGAGVACRAAALRPELVDRADVGRAVDAVPEPVERGAAPVGRVAPPQQLAVHLVVGADHERLDEAGVGLEQGDGVVGDLADAGQEPVRVGVGQRPVQRLGQIAGRPSPGRAGPLAQAVDRAMPVRSGAGADAHGQPGAGLDDAACGSIGGDERRLGRRRGRAASAAGMIDVAVIARAAALASNAVDEGPDDLGSLTGGSIDSVGRFGPIGRAWPPGLREGGPRPSVRRAVVRAGAGGPTPSVDRDGREPGARVRRSRDGCGRPRRAGRRWVTAPSGSSRATAGEPCPAQRVVGPRATGSKRVELQQLRLDAAGADGKHEPDGLGVAAHRADDRRGEPSDGGRAVPAEAAVPVERGRAATTASIAASWRGSRTPVLARSGRSTTSRADRRCARAR